LAQRQTRRPKAKGTTNPPPTRVSGTPSSPASKQPSARARVLVIDDSEIARDAMVAVLQGAGFSVSSLPSPIGSTREVIRNKIQVVVIDINMPALRGDSLAKLFRENTTFKDLRLVLISSTTASDIKRMAEQVNADAYLTKAQIHDDLAKIVRDLVAKPAA